MEIVAERLRSAESLYSQGMFTEAVTIYRHLLDQHPGLVEAQYNLGLAYRELLLFDRAEEAFRQALSIKPDLLEAAHNLCVCIQEQGRIAEALDMAIGLSEQFPDSADVRFSLGFLRLLSGEFTAGWQGYEARFTTHDPVFLRHEDRPLWDGKSIAGPLLLYAEQGFGDALMALRYVPLVAERGVEVMLEVPDTLRDLAARVKGVSGCYARGAVPPTHAAQLPLMSLPRVFGTTIDNIPAEVPYLEPDPILVQQWRQLLPKDGRILAGVAWSGRQDLPVNRKRSCPPDLLLPLMKVQGIAFVNLQVGESSEGPLNPFLIDLTAGMTDFHQTAALIANLDLVITIDTSVAHLAGAMGKSVWTLLPLVPDWRWLLDREDSPWYPTMRLFRQSSLHDWAGVIERVRRELEALTSGEIRTASTEPVGSRWPSDVGQLRDTIRHNRHDLAAYLRLGDLFHGQGNYAEAVEVYREALEVNPGWGEVHHNLGNALLELRRYAEAIVHYHEAVKLIPDFAEGYVTIATAFQSIGRPHDALASCQRALEIDQTCAEAHWNRALALLQLGDYVEGWREFEWRWRKRRYTSPIRTFDSPSWKGEPLSGRTILIHAEQAFGDTIQFARFLPLVADRGGVVVCEVPRPLVSLLKGVKGVTQVIAAGEQLPPFDCHLPLLSLPHVFGTTLENIPHVVPYVVPSAASVAQWRKLLAEYRTLRVGLAWAGRTFPDPGRTCPFSILTSLAGFEGITFFSLQMVEKGEEASSLSETRWLVDLTDRINDFNDTAAFIANLDLVISIDTAVAHLSGALGIPTWTLLPFAADWRWLIDREDSPWYPTMRLFRQLSPNGWQEVIDRVMEGLAACTSLTLFRYRPGIHFTDMPLLGGRPVPLPEILGQNSGKVGGVSIIETDDPAEADFITFPYYLEQLTEFATIEGLWDFLRQLPYFQDMEQKNVFFSDHDSPARYYTDSVWFRASVKSPQRDANCFVFPYAVEDLKQYTHFDVSCIRYHVTFAGYIGHCKERAPLLNAVSAEPQLVAGIDVIDTFHSHLDGRQREVRRKRYLELIAQSLAVICPRGDGENSIRFFETMSMGRIPILVSDCPLPFEERIDYESFMLRIPESETGSAGHIIYSWLKGQTDQELLQRCRSARQTWENYFSSERLVETVVRQLVSCKLLRTVHRLTSSGNDEIASNEFCATDVPTILDEGNRFLEQHDAIAAEQRFRAAQLASPRNPAVYLALGKALKQQGREREAESAFEEALQYNHRNVEAYLLLGDMHVNQGRDCDAIRRFYQAATVNPSDPVPYLHAILPLIRAGRYEETRYCCRKVREILPQNADLTMVDNLERMIPVE